MNDKTRGLYNKYEVYRLDGKHKDADYFVLDLTNDPYSTAAIIAYAKACRHAYPQLAMDLMKKIYPGFEDSEVLEWPELI